MSKSADFPEKFNITVTSASGVERALKSELNRLNILDCAFENGATTFFGDKLTLAKCNVNLRTADRVYVEIAKFSATTFDGLFDQTYDIDWQNYLPKSASVIVNGNSVKSTLFSISDCQKIIKKAISKKLCAYYGVNYLEEDGARYEIDFYIFKNVVYLRLNSSGAGLHKRGYRDLVGIAPIKETLASALLLYSDFYYKRPFIDPFCGSGTLLIEGAKIALNIAGGILRKFDFNYWTNFDKKYYDLAYAEAKDNEIRDRNLEFYGYDIDKKAVALAKHHAERAGILDKVKIKTQDVKCLKTQFNYGTIVTNPPYGERVYDKEQAEECYKALGKFKAENPNWSIFAITSANNFERHFGKKADREKKLFNSNKQCKYYFYYGKKGE